MPVLLALATTLRNTMLNAITTAIDAGAGAGLLRVYTGTRPATGAAITTEVLLGTLTFTDPSAPAAAAGVLTFSPIASDTSADATGTASWCRIVDSTGTFVADGNVGTATSDYILNTVSITLGQTISCTSATITDGNS